MNPTHFWKIILAAIILLIVVLMSIDPLLSFKDARQRQATTPTSRPLPPNGFSEVFIHIGWPKNNVTVSYYFLDTPSNRPFLVWSENSKDPLPETISVKWKTATPPPRLKLIGYPSFNWGTPTKPIPILGQTIYKKQIFSLPSSISFSKLVLILESQETPL